MNNKLVEMAKELLLIESDLPYRLNYTEDLNISINDFELYTFTQVWGSTALGFSGFGGQAMTEARTYVFVPINCNQKCFIYFGSRFAYEADYCDALKEDIGNHQIESVIKAGKYKK